MGDTFHDFQSTSQASIAKLAYQLRKTTGIFNIPCFPIMTFLEHILPKLPRFHLEVGSREDMAENEGQTCPTGRFIRLREDVYEGGWKGESRARFTAAHELGHWILHSDFPLPRADIREKTKHFRDFEAEANHFAASFLVPDHYLHSGDDPKVTARLHGVSWKTARNRIKYVERQKKKRRSQAATELLPVSALGKKDA